MATTWDEGTGAWRACAALPVGTIGLVRPVADAERIGFLGPGEGGTGPFGSPSVQLAPSDWSERKSGRSGAPPGRTMILCGFRLTVHVRSQTIPQKTGFSMALRAEGRLLGSICDVPHPLDRHVALDMLHPRVYLSKACDLLVFEVGIKNAEQTQLQPVLQSLVTSWPRLDPTSERQKNTKAWRKRSLPWLPLAWVQA